MFKAARWRSEKNRTKAVFKLQFHAAQVLQLESQAVMVSLVPPDAARPTTRSDKVAAVDGACNWANPVFESVKLARNPKNGKMDEKVYRFLVSAAESNKAEILGEASLNLADYSEAFKPSSVALPLKGSSTGAILHITIQRMQGDGEERGGDEDGEALLKRQRRTLQSQLSKWDEDGSHLNNQAKAKFASKRDIPHHNADSDGILQKSHSFDAVSASGSDTSSGVYTPRENGIVKHNNQRDPTSFLSPLTRMFSSDDLSGASAPDGSADASTSSSGDAGLNETSRDSEDSIEKLKSDMDILTRKVEVSDLELQTLRKQVVKENKRSQDLLRELSSVKEERDSLKRECDQLKLFEKRKQLDGSQHDGDDLLSLLEEIKQELDHEKNLNVHLRLQLKMTQEANSELAVAVKDLDGVLEHKGREPFCTRCSKIDMNPETAQEYKQLPETVSQDDSEEQYALDALVNERDDMKVSYSLEHKIIDLNNEVEYYRKDREDLEMQMEQLALDYEILKQENHDITTKMEQMQLREQLRMQYECSAHLAIISDLETNVECLENELQKQAEAFEEDIAAITQAKIEQEKRAILAEEALRTTKWKHSKNVERLQEDFRSISSHMSTTFQVNEKIFMQTLKENAELRSQRSRLEDLLEKSNRSVVLLQDQYRMKLIQLLGLVDFKSKEVDRLLLDLKNMKIELGNYKKSEEARRNNSLDELQLLKTEMESLKLEKYIFFKENEQNEKLLDEVKILRSSAAENEESIQEKNLELDSPRKKLAVLGAEVCKSLEEINELSHMKDEKGTVIDALESEAAILGQQKDILMQASYENELEKQHLQRSIFHSSGTLLEEKQMNKPCEEKIDGNCATTSADVKMGQVKLSDSSIDLKKDLGNTIEKMSEFIQDDEKFCQSSECTSNGMSDTNKELLISVSRTAGPNLDENQILADQKKVVDASSEMAALREQNKSMHSELKELQERYSEISLKFAEVEGERQQLLMTVRSLKSALKN